MLLLSVGYMETKEEQLITTEGEYSLIWKQKI